MSTKGLGVNLQLLSNREKTLLIEALREHYGFPELLARVGLARSDQFPSFDVKLDALLSSKRALATDTLNGCSDLKASDFADFG